MTRSLLYASVVTGLLAGVLMAQAKARHVAKDTLRVCTDAALELESQIRAYRGNCRTFAFAQHGDSIYYQVECAK